MLMNKITLFTCKMGLNLMKSGDTFSAWEEQENNKDVKIIVEESNLDYSYVEEVYYVEDINKVEIIK